MRQSFCHLRHYIFFVDVFLSQMCNSYIKCIHTTFTLMEKLDSSTAEQRATINARQSRWVLLWGFFKEIAILDETEFFRLTFKCLGVSK